MSHLCQFTDTTGLTCLRRDEECGCYASGRSDGIAAERARVVALLSQAVGCIRIGDRYAEGRADCLQWALREIKRGGK